MKGIFNDNPIYAMVFSHGGVVIDPIEARLTMNDIRQAELIITRDLLRPDVYHVVKDRLASEKVLDCDGVHDALVDTVARVKKYAETV